MSHERMDDRMAGALPKEETPPVGSQMVAFKIDWERKLLVMGIPLGDGNACFQEGTARDWYPIFELGLKMCRDLERGGGEPPR